MASFPIPSGFPAGGMRRPQRQRSGAAQAVGALQEGVGAGQALMQMVQAYKDRGKRAEAHEITKRIMFGEANEQDVRRLAEVMPITEALQWKQTFHQQLQRKSEKEKLGVLERTKAANASVMKFMLRISSADHQEMGPPYKPGQTQQRVLFENAYPKFQQELAKTPEGQDKVGFLLPMLRSALADGVIDDEEQMNILTALQVATGRLDDGISNLMEMIGKRGDDATDAAAAERKRRATERGEWQKHAYRSQEDGATPLPGPPSPGAPGQGPASPAAAAGNVAEAARRARELIDRNRNRNRSP